MTAGQDMQHAPIQQPITLTRMGHYFTPTSSEGETLAGHCQAAMVVDTMEPEANSTLLYGEEVWTVTLKVWTHDGNEQTRSSVRFEEPVGGHASFHLSQTCPWGR